MLVVAFSFMSSADEARNIVNFPKKSLSSHTKGFADAIVLPIDETRDVGMIGKVQQEYIKELYPNHRVILSVYIKDQKGCYIEAVSCVNSDDEMVQVYFDMSNVYKHLKNQNEKSKLEIEKLEKSYVIVQ